MADTIVLATASASMVDIPLWMQATGGDAALVNSANDYRALIDNIYDAEGVNSLGDFTVTQRGAGANFSVDVSAGAAVVQGDNVANQGKFLVVQTGTVNVTTPTAPGSGTRTHRLCVQIRDGEQLGDHVYTWELHLIEDTGAGLPAQPNSAITIATISIATGQASVLNANITDLRPWAATPRGAQLFGRVVLTNSTTSTVTFSNIPQTAQVLEIMCTTHTQAAAWFVNVNLRINGASSTNYNSCRLENGAGVNGSSLAVGGGVFSSAQSAWLVGDAMGTLAVASGNGGIFGRIPLYTNSFDKIYIGESYASDGTANFAEHRRVAGTFNGSTAAITQLDIICSSSTFTTGSTFLLYGIA